MPFTIKSKVEGAEGVLKALDGVEKKLRKKLIRKAVAAAGKVILSRAKQLVFTKSKTLKKSLGRKVKVYSSGVAVVVVGPRVGFKKEVVRDGRTVLANPVKYAHLVELGTRPHRYKTRAGRHPGATAKPFLRPAVEGIQATIRKVMSREIEQGLANQA